jgi:diguanylate cyclase (GGDEF)-like protein
VLFLDLDDFKQVNDVLGHAAGDALLVDAAERMRSCLRPDDLLARLGGDEFAVLLAGVGAVEGTAAAARLRESLAQPFPATADRPAVVTGASIGVAAAVDGDTERSLLSHADVAMYAAKAAGKGCFRVFEEGMRDRLLARISAEMDLRAALEREEVFLQYQPVVHAPTGEVVGAEALVRWNHPVRGLVPPNDFIPVAEASGLIVPLGSWVLHEACRAAVSWPGQHPARAPASASTCRPASWCTGTWPPTSVVRWPLRPRAGAPDARGHRDSAGRDRGRRPGLPDRGACDWGCGSRWTTSGPATRP